MSGLQVIVAAQDLNAKGPVKFAHPRAMVMSSSKGRVMDVRFGGSSLTGWAARLETVRQCTASAGTPHRLGCRACSGCFVASHGTSKLRSVRRSIGPGSWYASIGGTTDLLEGRRAKLHYGLEHKTGWSAA